MNLCNYRIALFLINNKCCFLDCRYVSFSPLLPWILSGKRITQTVHKIQHTRRILDTKRILWTCLNTYYINPTRLWWMKNDCKKLLTLGQRKWRCAILFFRSKKHHTTKTEVKKQIKNKAVVFWKIIQLLCGRHLDDFAPSGAAQNLQSHVATVSVVTRTRTE